MIPFSYNTRSILRRRFSAFATAFGLGLVVFVFAAVLMLARGVEETLKATGSPENAVLLRKGSSSELTSFVPREAAKTFAADPAVAIEGGKAVASPEIFVIFQLQRIDGNGTANVGFRGVTPDGWALLRSKTIKLREGRLPQWGTSEVMIGRATKGRYKGSDLGQAISIARRQWQVVGVFESAGSGFESEVWADADQIADASHRTGYSTMTMKLKSPSEFASLRATVDADPRWNLEAKREDKFYEEASGQLAGFIRVLGSFLIESLLLSLLGAVGGCIFATFLAALSFTTTNWSSFTEIKFQFHFAPDIAVKATIFAVVMGLLGGFLPAARAARLQIAEATKG